MDNFTQACIISNSRWVEGLEAELSVHAFSKAHEKAMKSIIGSLGSGSSHNISRLFVAALIAAIIITITCLTVMGIPQTYDYTITQKADSAYYEVVYNRNERPKEVKNITVGYIPEGYAPYNFNEGSSGYFYVYRYGETEKEISVSKNILAGAYQFDNEEYPYEIVKQREIDYIIYRSNEASYGIIWNANGYMYCVTSTDLSRQELIKIAKNVK